MTREETIKWLESLKVEIGRPERVSLWHYAEAIDMAIEALRDEEYLPISCSECPLGNTGGTDWGTWTDWYEGQQEYEILAWKCLPDPYEESEG